MGWLTPRQDNAARRSDALRSVLGFVRRHLPFEERLRRWLPERVVNRMRQLSLNIERVDWERTRAYRFPMYHPVEGIEINLRGRQPQGTVEPGAEFHALREQIIRALREVRDPDGSAPIVQAVYRSEELYHGPYLSIAPDIVFLTTPDYKADAGLAESLVAPAPLAGLDKNSGVHTVEGIVIVYGSTVRPGYGISDMEIADIAPTLLYALGEPIPESMDGRVRKDIFLPSWAALHEIRYQLTYARQLIPDTGVSEEEEAQMRDKLRGLGYIE
jgi:predicted AlkP superfamily phosphohydrolase/phosphomutase